MSDRSMWMAKAMDAEINIEGMDAEDTTVEVEMGLVGSEVRLTIGPLSVLMNYEQSQRLDAALHPYFEEPK